MIRPEDIDLVKPEEGTIRGVVTHLIFKGVHYEMEVTVNGFDLLVHSTDMFPVGQEVGIHVDPFDIQIMNKPESKMRRRQPLKSNKLKKWLAGPYAVWAAFHHHPADPDSLLCVDSQEGGFTLSNFAYVTTQENIKALGLALWLSLLSTAICLLACLSACHDSGKPECQSDQLYCADLHSPDVDELSAPHACMADTSEKNGVINSILSFFHLPGISIINTPGAIILGMVYNFLPFMVLPIYNVLIKIDRDVINAARDLGANSVLRLS